MVRKGGFEPPRLSAPPPQDGVSASSTTSALGRTSSDEQSSLAAVHYSKASYRDWRRQPELGDFKEYEWICRVGAVHNAIATARETVWAGKGSLFSETGCPLKFHRYIAAYARHGLQASARSSRSRALFNPTARSRPRSLDGNASGSPSARIAMYCAVQLPIPGISQRRAKNASQSTIPSKLIRPSHTARARPRMV